MNSQFEIEEEEDKIFLQYEKNFTLLKIYKNSILPCNMHLTSDIYLNLDILDINDHEQINNNFDYYLNKLSVFFEYTLNNTVVFDKNNNWAINSFIDLKKNEKLIENNIMLTINEPTNDHLVILLHCKLNSLGENILEFYSLTLSDDKSRDVSFTFVGDSRKLIQLIPEDDWFKNTYHEEPWWLRSDFSTIDLKKLDDIKTPYYVNSVEENILEKIESVVRKNKNNEEKIIKINKFVPKIIKKDD